MDRSLAEEKKQVEGAPSGVFRFGWVVIYKGQSEERFQAVQERLALFGIEHRGLSFTTGNRLAAQGLVNAANPAFTQRAQFSTAGMQARLLSDKRMDSYTVEVRKRDEEKARMALRSGA